MKYIIKKHAQGKWNRQHDYFDSDAEAKIWARGELGETCDLVLLYRHDTKDTPEMNNLVAAFETY